MLCSKRFLQERKLTPRAEIVGFAKVGGEPIEMGLAPIRCVKQLVGELKQFSKMRAMISCIKDRVV